MGKSLLFIPFVLAILILTGCAQNQPLCKTPYFEFQEGQCCLDENNNSMCDNDEASRVQKQEEVTPPAPKTEVAIPKEEPKQDYTLEQAFQNINSALGKNWQFVKDEEFSDEEAENWHPYGSISLMSVWFMKNKKIESVNDFETFIMDNRKTSVKTLTEEIEASQEEQRDSFTNKTFAYILIHDFDNLETPGLLEEAIKIKYYRSEDFKKAEHVDDAEYYQRIFIWCSPKILINVKPEMKGQVYTAWDSFYSDYDNLDERIAAVNAEIDIYIQNSRRNILPQAKLILENCPKK